MTHTPLPTDPNIPPSPGMGAINAIREKAAEIRQGLKDGTIRLGTGTETPAAPAPAPTPAATVPPAAPAETPTPVAGEAAPEAQLEAAPEVTDGGEAAPEGEGEAAPEEDVVMFRLPGRRPNDKIHEIAVPADDAETLERLRQLNNDAMRGRNLAREQTAVLKDKQELEYIERQLAADPAGFIVEKVQPQVAKDVVLALLAQPGILEQVEDIIDNWRASPESRRADSVDLTQKFSNNRKEAEREFRQHVERERVVHELTQHVQLIASALPQGQEDFVEDAFRDLERHYSNPNVENRSLSLDEMVKVLAKRIAMYGSDAERIQKVLDYGVEEPPIPPARPDPAAAKRLEAARSTGSRLVRSAAAKQAAALVPAGPAPVSPGPAAMPAGQRFEDRVKEIRTRFNLPDRSPKPRGNPLAK